MKVVIFGASGALGNECVEQCLAEGHEVRVLARTPAKFRESMRAQISIEQGDVLDAEAIARVLAGGCDAVLFAVGIDKKSPEDLCTTATRHIFERMRKEGIQRFIWCGGGSTPVAEDDLTLGAYFVQFFASTFMGLRHRDKVHQLAFLNENKDLDWFGIRPLQMGEGVRKEKYRLGFDRFSGLSKISFADCAHAMVGMLTDDTWRHQSPIVQY